MASGKMKRRRRLVSSSSFAIPLGLGLATITTLLATATCTAAATSARTFLGRSRYRVNHRHGASSSAPSFSYGAGTDDSDSAAGVEEVMSSLVAKLVSPSINNNHSEEEEARLWKRLGKLRLDAGEYAEAARIFRRGSHRCPSDDGLRHHCRVYDAFHRGDNDSDDDDNNADGAGSSSTKAIPDPLHMPADADDDLFLILDVPPGNVPANIVEFSGVGGGTAAAAAAASAPSLTRIICASQRPVLSREACRFLIDSAQEAAAQRGGWTTDRHIHAPTCDVPAFELHPAAVRWIRRGLTDVLLPLVASTMPPELGLTAANLRIQDCFVVRYDGKDDQEGQSGSEENEPPPGFASLKPHEDESLVSLTIVLNDMSDYEGGGLFIASTGDLLNGDAGTVLSFAGGLVHGGYPVSKGTRWILTVFLYIDKNLSGREPGYTIDAIEAGVAAKQKELGVDSLK